MSKKIITVAILGCGGRGGEAYGRLFWQEKDKYKIVTLCDINEEKLQKYGKNFDVSQEQLFSDTKEFLSQKRADLLVIATLDADHVWQCIMGLQAGYDILLEKPITDNKDECLQLLKAQKKYGKKVLVCHVLRYANAFIKVAELLEQGSIGNLVEIQALEQVSYWHYAHSYVRGNWRRSDETTPMILAKSCHDLDLLQYYAKSKCKSVSSVGDLTYFKTKNAPSGAATRCTDCMLIESCPYSAKKIYIDAWKNKGCPENGWPYNVITLAQPLTQSALMEAISKGPYGRCVFACDNDVVDHQHVSISFENGVKATLTMMPFTANGGRIMRFFGTLGEILLDEEQNLIEVMPFGKEKQKIIIDIPVESGYAHGGGDYGLVTSLYDILLGQLSLETALEASIESHLMGICAETSRKNGGKLIFVHA